MAVGNSLPAPTHSQNLIGHRIDDGKLEFVSVLGLGAYGVVYLARDVSDPEGEGVTGAPDNPPGSYYAVKCLNKVGMDGRQRSFQRREIALHGLASTHDNVATLHNVIETPTCIYVILAYYADGDLFGMITERGRYLADDELIRSVFLQIIDAVDYCHRLGIYHRDLKPENILCNDDGRTVALADFGLATAEKTSGDFGCGSTFYMSPECQGGLFQRLGSYSTMHNDVWSLGVILVNLTCGRNPWKQACPTDETFRAYLQNCDFLRAILPVSAACNNLLKRIFTLSPAQRITMSELRSEVKRIKRWTMTEAELRHATRATREAARAFAPAPPSPKTSQKPSPKASPIVAANSWGDAAIPATLEEVMRFRGDHGALSGGAGSQSTSGSFASSTSRHTNWQAFNPCSKSTGASSRRPASPATPTRSSASASSAPRQQQALPPTPPHTPRRRRPSLHSAASDPRPYTEEELNDVNDAELLDAMDLDTPPRLPAFVQTPPTPPTPTTPRMAAPRPLIKRRVEPTTMPEPDFAASDSSSSSGSSSSSSAWSRMPHTPDGASFNAMGEPKVVVVSPSPSGASISSTASIVSDASTKASYVSCYSRYMDWAEAQMGESFEMPVDAPASPPLTAPSSPTSHADVFARHQWAQQETFAHHHRSHRPREQAIRAG